MSLRQDPKAVGCPVHRSAVITRIRIHSITEVGWDVAMVNVILLTSHVPCRVRLSDIAGDFSQGSTILGVAKEGSFDSKGIRDRPLGFHLLQQVGIPAIPLESWILIPILAIEGSAEIHQRSEEHTSELQSLMRISYAVFCLKTKNKTHHITTPL